jgi:hypothetical protein
MGRGATPLSPTTPKQNQQEPARASEKEKKMPKITPKEVQVTPEELDEIIKWAEYLGCNVWFNASRNGWQVNKQCFQIEVSLEAKKYIKG